MAADDTKLRVFLAITLPNPLQRKLGKWLQGLGDRIHGVRWIAPENLHLTLRFLGSVDAATLEDVRARSAAVAAAAQPGQLTAVGTGLFRSLSQPRIAWIGVQGDVTAVEQLQRELETALDGLDINPADRRQTFHPHITIGRIRRPNKVLGLEHFIMAGKDKHFGEFPLDAVSLVKSELTREGARYTTLDRYVVGGAERQ